MYEYEKPEIEVVVFDSEDVIVTSQFSTKDNSDDIVFPDVPLG